MNDKLLDQFLWGFYGYGDWTAPIWFLGMEEGGGENAAEVDRRLELWDSRGQPDLLDVHDLLGAVGNTDWIGEGNALQPTWAGLIRLLLSAQGKDSGNDAVRRFQGDVWGRTGSRTCAIELFPLPSPSIRAWNYWEWSQSPHLINRMVYQHATFSYRARRIVERIKKYSPKAVVCYGTTYHDYWEGVSGGSIGRAKGKIVRHAERGGTHWFVVPHPAARGVTPADFFNAGELVGKIMGVGVA